MQKQAYLPALKITSIDFPFTLFVFQWSLLGMRFIVDFQGPNSRLF